MITRGDERRVAYIFITTYIPMLGRALGFMLIVLSLLGVIT